MSVDLRTRYLGLELKNPLVVAACTLTEKADKMKRLEDAGAAAVVIHSLFEEQIEFEAVELTAAEEMGSEFYAEHSNWYPEQEDYRRGPEDYLTNVTEAKRAVSIPVIASLNGTSKGGWIRYAKLMQDAGADALELNIYFIAASIDQSAADVEQQYLDLVAAVKAEVSIPVAVKIGPYFSSPGNMCKRLVEAGADGLVLFNRFLQPDIDVEEMAVSPDLVLSTEHELLLPMRWIAILHGRVETSLALTTGIHSGQAMLKALLAGADVGMIASVLYQRGIDVAGTILKDLTDWMAAHDYESVTQLRGSMSQRNCPDPAAFERGNYMKALASYTGGVI